MNKFHGASHWPLMSNNITISDRQALIDFLSDYDARLTHGPKTIEFEKRWAQWLGIKHAVFVNSGASANDISMLIVKELFGYGDVIVPPLTWVSDVASILHAGLNPVFVDIDKKNLALDPKLVKQSINQNTKAVFLTHILGLNGLSEDLMEVCLDGNVALIEDVCESHGATWKNRKLGTYGTLSNFSFYYAHHLTTIEGGMICTNSDEIYDLARMYRSHGLVRESSNQQFKNRIMSNHPDLNSEFIFYSAAHNMRPTEIGAVLGINQLQHLDHNIEIRNRNFHYFLSKLNKNRFFTEFSLNGCSNYALILIMKEPNIEQRDEIESLMKMSNIEFRRGLSGGGNQTRQPYLKKAGFHFDPTDFPVTEQIHHYSWYVGNFPDLELSEIDRLCDLLN